MDEIARAVLYLKRIKRTGSFEKEELFCANKFIFNEAYKKGLSDEYMKVIVDVMKISNLPFAEFEELIRCLIPIKYMPEAIVFDISLWILSYYDEISHPKLVVVIQWLTGIIRNELVKTDKLDGLYNGFFMLLLKGNIDLHLCLFIQLLTKPALVRPMHVSILQKLREKKGKKKQYDNLLSVLKRLKPHLVEESIPIAGGDQATMTPSTCSWKGLMMAKLRCNPQENITLDEITNAKHKEFSSFIPHISYLTECKINRKSLLEIQDWESLGAYFVDLEAPCQSLSLLRCHFGLFFIAFGGRALQRRFSSILYAKLYDVFLRDRSHLSDIDPIIRRRDESGLLLQLATLQEYISQPIPAVSVFLAKYLCIWNGESHRVAVLRLLSYLYFTSYEELKCCILDPLYWLFISGDVEFKAAIINLLKQFMKNLILKEEWKEGEKIPFAGFGRKWKPTEVYPKLFNSISELIGTGISAENGNTFLLYTSLSYYHQMISILKELNVEYFMIPPPSVIYHSLFSYSLVCLSESCSLLFRYNTEIYPLLVTQESEENFKEDLGMLGIYIDDYVRFLCSNEPFKNRKRSYIFENLSENTLEELAKIINIKFSSNLCNHPSFAPYRIIYKEGNQTVSFKTFYAIAEKNYPGISDFIKRFGPPLD